MGSMAAKLDSTLERLWLVNRSRSLLVRGLHSPPFKISRPLFQHITQYMTYPPCPGSVIPGQHDTQELKPWPAVKLQHCSSQCDPVTMRNLSYAMVTAWERRLLDQA